MDSIIFFLKKRILFFILILVFSSCAKISYLLEQGGGQIRLLCDSRPNEELLEDENISRKDKEKIKEIKIYKEYFYSYWKKEKKEIYSHTTILRDKAVTYLVIVSPHNKINALKECFPIMGCFPYLGFFKESSAKSYALGKEKEGFITYIRPVYAYSTLGYFTDPILSSFFYYKKEALAELIFHELFHTIFFIKNEVQLNENLASFFAGRMVQDYFQKTAEEVDSNKERKEEITALSSEIVSLTKRLNLEYEKRETSTKESNLLFFNNYMKTIFRPKVRAKCLELNISDKRCFPSNRKWNNASLAAFLTYEEKIDYLSLIKKEKKLNLRDFFKFIESEHQRFESQDNIKSFSKFLFLKVK